MASISATNRLRIVIHIPPPAINSRFGQARQCVYGPFTWDRCPRLLGGNLGRVILVHEGTAADLPKICDIKVHNWADTYRPLLDPEVLRPFLDPATQLAELRRDFLRPDGLLLVAQEGSMDRDEDISGFALTYVSADPAPWLESLHVLRESRGQGTGTRLMQATAAELISLGHNSMRLGVISGNLAAARFYERLGGMLLGVEPVSWAPGVTHMVYAWSDLRPLVEIRTSTSSG